MPKKNSLSEYADVLQSLGFSAESSEEVVAMFAESFMKSSKHSSSSASFEEINWTKQFETGQGPGPEKEGNYHTGLSTKKGRGQLRIGKGPGNMGKVKQDEPEMLSGPALEKGPGNPQGGSSRDVQGMQMLG